MKILLAHKFFKLNGGADVFFFEVGRVLRENGHQVAYFSTKDKDNFDSEYADYFADAPKFKDVGTMKKIQSLMFIPYNFKTKRKFTKLLNDFKPDLIHVFNIMTQISPSILDAARKKKVPVIISCNDYKHICPNYKLFHHGKICEDCKSSKFYNCIKNRCAHDSIQFSAASTIESYLHHFLNIYKKNIKLFLFASDFMALKTVEFWGDDFKWGKLLNPFKITEENRFTQSGKYGLYFGRLSEEKGVDVLINAINIKKDVPFKIVGDGPEFDKLKDYVAKNDISNIEFLGAKWGSDLNMILENSKFVVVPSVWHENFPYVILQAFSASKPVIGTNRGGIPELITPERGLIYNSEDPNDLADQIEKLYNDDSLCENMGKNARNFVVENFNDVKFYEQIMFNYQKILK